MLDKKHSKLHSLPSNRMLVSKDYAFTLFTVIRSDLSCTVIQRDCGYCIYLYEAVYKYLGPRYLFLVHEQVPRGGKNTYKYCTDPGDKTVLAVSTPRMKPCMQKTSADD